jgi:hypothetical protein
MQSGFSVDLRGRAGHGKSFTLGQFPAIMKEAYPTKNYGISTIDGATLTNSTAMGWMRLGEADKYGDFRSIFSNPFWMYTDEGKHLREYDGGLIIVDDWHYIDIEIKRILIQAMYRGILANHDFRQYNWAMWTAGNRQAIDRSGGTKEYDMMINRQDRVDIEDDLEGMLQSLRDIGCMEVTVEFAEKYALDHIYVDPPAIQGPFCTPRSLAASDTFLRNCMELFGIDEPPTDPNIHEFINGSLGKPAGEDYMSYLTEYNALPKYKAIIANPKTVKMPPDDRPDLWRLQAYALAKDVQVRDADQALVYMSRFPQEFQTIFVRAATDNKSRILLAPKVKEWCKSNLALVAAISGLEENRVEG